MTNIFPREETHGLVNQMRRYAVSITSNIAEGFSRSSYKDKAHFYAIALGSITEIQNQLLIAKDVGYIKKDTFLELADNTNEMHKLLNGLIKKSHSLHLNS